MFQQKTQKRRAQSSAEVRGVRLHSRTLQQQRFDAVRVHHRFARRPRKDREAAVLRRDERHRVALIVHELRGRQMPRAAELRRMHDRGRRRPRSVPSRSPARPAATLCAARSWRRTPASRIPWSSPSRRRRRSAPRCASTTRPTASCHNRHRGPSGVSRVSSRELGERRATRRSGSAARSTRARPGSPPARRAAALHVRAPASTRPAARARSPSGVSNADDSKPMSDASSEGQSGRLGACSSTILI